VLCFSRSRTFKIETEVEKEKEEPPGEMVERRDHAVAGGELLRTKEQRVETRGPFTRHATKEKKERKHPIGGKLVAEGRWCLTLHTAPPVRAESFGTQCERKRTHEHPRFTRALGDLAIPWKKKVDWGNGGPRLILKGGKTPPRIER